MARDFTRPTLKLTQMLRNTANVPIAEEAHGMVPMPMNSEVNHVVTQQGGQRRRLEDAGPSRPLNRPREPRCIRYNGRTIRSLELAKRWTASVFREVEE